MGVCKVVQEAQIVTRRSHCELATETTPYRGARPETLSIRTPAPRHFSAAHLRHILSRQARPLYPVYLGRSPRFSQLLGADSTRQTEPMILPRRLLLAPPQEAGASHLVTKPTILDLSIRKTGRRCTSLQRSRNA
jgi:hypothetical protein